MSEKPYKHALGVIELLNATNYAIWKRQCGRVLKGIRAWNIVLGEEQQPNNPAGFTSAAVAERSIYNDYVQRREQASAIICGSCCNEVQIHVEEIDDPAEMWTVLAARMDAAGTVVGRMTILRKFHALRPIAGQPINTYFSRLLEVKNQLAGSAQAISDAEFQNHLYTSLPSMFDVIVVILQARADPTIQEVLDALKEHEQNHTMTVKPDSASEVLYTQHGGNQRGRGGRGTNHGRRNYNGKECSQKWYEECKKGTHMTADSWYNEKNNKRTYDQGTNGCYYCGEEGHIQYNCPAKRKGNALLNNRASIPQGANQRT
jgi:hypothetical protein